ncbi:hypothetical protein AB7M33_005239 [Pseudomonas sp. Y3 TE3536]
MDIRESSELEALKLERKRRETDQYFAKRRRRNQVVFLTSLFVAGMFYVSAAARYDRFLGIIQFPDEYSLLASYSLLLFALGFTLYFYVQGDSFWRFPKKQAPRALAPDVKSSFEGRINELEFHVNSLATAFAGQHASSRDDFVGEMADLIKSKAHADLLGQLEDQVSRAAGIERALTPIREAYDLARARLVSEVEALGRRGTVNLVFGVVTTAGALGILMSLALNTIGPDAYRVLVPDKNFDIVVLAIMFLPKLSLAIFVQVFSLFFLRLYKAGFSEIKFFQNELTNLEAKYLGLVSAVVSDDEESVREASKALLAVERNHVLSKGQTTIELEKHKIENQSSSEVIKLLPKILHRRNGN